MTYNDLIVSKRILDRKHVTLLSTVYSCKEIDSGRKHWKTKEAVTKQEIIHYCNKYMGGVDSNDQLMQYSAFSRQAVKWWEKVFFCLLNLAVVNSFILYCEWLLSCNATKTELRKVVQTEFRTQVINQMIAKSGDKITPSCIPKCTSAPGFEIQRLSGRHFIQKIIVDKQKTCIRPQQIDLLLCVN